MPQKTILLSAPYMLPYKERFLPVLAHYGLEVIIPEWKERLSEGDILRYAGQFDGSICGDDKYTRAVISRCVPRLKVISKWGTGIDSIDQEAAREMGVAVCRTTNAFTVPVSDSVMGYILAFARRQPWMDKDVKSGVWQKQPGRSLSECALGVIGVGFIGKEVLRKAHAFGMELLANDIIPIPDDFVRALDIQPVGLEELLSRADFISVNCDLNPTSYHLINDKTLALALKNAVIINTARGPIIDEPALVRALESGQIAGAALDVFEDEPLPDESPLKRMEHVMLAPHNSNSSPRVWERVHWLTIRNLLAGLDVPHDDLDEIQKQNF